jgi:formylglycine-generating enzyme required for sulfatase activity
MQAGDCGNCGTVSERCEGGMWVPQGNCLNEGPCGPGEVETQPLPACGEQQRICMNDCQWTDFTVTVPSRECEPDERRIAQLDCAAGFGRVQTCSASCMWVTGSGPCVDACGEAPRTTTNADEEEICIPAGDFIRGQVGLPGAEPVTTVTVSAFYIDKYTVTNRRYKACRDAGVCANPSDGSGSGLAALEDPALAGRWVRGITWNDAATFCAWDGSRRLLTEAEWEKAARGPAPRTHVYPAWDTAWDCAALPAEWCPGVFYGGGTDYYNATAISYDASYYGVVGMSSLGRQWVSDWYSVTYYTDLTSLVDPQGPTSGTQRVVRGAARRYPDDPQVSARTSGYPTQPDGSKTIRCGRTAPGL